MMVLIDLEELKEKIIVNLVFILQTCSCYWNGFAKSDARKAGGTIS
uniref:Uncharacterized protein n=1 Tax=Tetranychus urticae TaxID=32264 RepID=T1L6L8_TETUR